LVIPYLHQPSISLGPITLQAFGFILAISVVVAEALYRKRLRQLALDVDTGMSLAWYALVTGFICAHLFSVLLYFPDKVARNPLLLFKVWEDVSSFGGMLGGALGAALYLMTRGRTIPTRMKWAYLDAVAFVTPFGWSIGRIACSLAHDHPGTLTTFPLAISLSSARAQAYITNVYAGEGLALPPPDQLAHLGFNDLGWYEFLYLACFVVPLFVWLDRRRPASTRRPGFWIIAFAALYAPMRLLLDPLRVQDAQYFGFTPGQYAAAGLLGVALLLAVKRRRSGGVGDDLSAT
jgi:phosphatidylglycerol:prolipoprotein diacylglycerol transferase